MQQPSGVLAPIGGTRGTDRSPIASRESCPDAEETVEPDLERLARAVDAAEPQERATLIEVQAAARRASETLGDARRDLRDLEDTEDIEPAALRALREQVSAVRDLQELADALAATTLSPSRIQAASERARLALEDLDRAVDVSPIAGDVLAQNLRRSGGARAGNGSRCAFRALSTRKAQCDGVRRS